MSEAAGGSSDFVASEWELAGRALNLAPKESRAFELIAQGKPDKQILSQMKIKYGTLRTYIRRAFDKTGTHSRTELAIKLGEIVSKIRNKKKR